MAQRAVQIADLQRQNAVLQTQAQTMHAAMQRDCESRHGTLSDVQMPDGAPGETRPECRLPLASCTVSTGSAFGSRMNSRSLS
jgi:hypothetical protein